MPESKRRKPKKPSRLRSQPASAAGAKVKAPSPTWYVVLMAGLMAGGLVLVLLRFIFNLDQIYLIGGLAAIAAGFLMTTSYR
jgi:predicted lipid-binding transport protein (Tim44 family)